MPSGCQAVTSCAEMAAVGLGMRREALTCLMVGGPHLLAPTGSDLGKYQQARDQYYDSTILYYTLLD